ncbi:hypothetical protein P7K49_000643 [Saguinus oedipus]|uniref:Protein phosphatase 1 regulatory subunit 14 n=1 Tax=Saguinus oedipus TaxID=9490 RepID=A0ABQ9WFY6_SAGOE|nr:hypothetical protein P7K49_000643 [Saguinus oedipus]
MIGGRIGGERAGHGQARPGGSACCSCPRAPLPPLLPQSRAERSERANPSQPAGVPEAAARGGARRTQATPAAAVADSGTAGGAALAAPAPGPGSAGPGPRVYFQSPGGADDEGPYDCKELRKRLNLEEWILEQLTCLYDCQEEEIPELEIDVDELLDMERAAG